jgi:hypothetical protein|nr:MAG TPA: hypothetical protein [Caudoviricetes sp.]
MRNRNLLLTVTAVMSFLGISAFAKDADGRSVLSAGDQQKLSDKWGQQFTEAFVKDLAELEKEGISAEESVKGVASQFEEQAKKDAETIAQLKREIKALQDDNAKLAKLPGVGGEAVIDQTGKMKKEFKPDMSLMHNKAYYAAATGDVWTGDSTVDTNELKTEFGKYVSSDKLSIFQKLVGPISCTSYMSTIITDKFEVRASQAAIDSVLQTFTPRFTPKGKSKFTPLTIKMYPMKINVSIYPSDIINDVLGYLYDEKLEPKDMPIVRYIVEQLIRPKLDEDRELALCKGRYKDPVATEDSFTPNKAEETCDGFLTQLCDLKKASDTDITWLLDGTAELGKGEELLDQIEQAVDAVSPLYKNKTMFIHADPDLIVKYGRAYRDKYPNTKNEDGEKIKVDFSRFTFGAIEGMRGTGAFFITPKENFKHIMSRDPKTMGLRMTTDDYQAKILGEWREGTGFWIKEAIFAYLPTALVDELAPAELGV